jgi:hypothetical protein
VRVFLLVSVGLTGLVIALFLLAPGSRLPALAPRLAAGEALQDAEARQAFAGWLAQLPDAPPTPLRARYQGSFRGENALDAQTLTDLDFELDLAFADARRGRAVLSIRGMEEGQDPGGDAEFGIVADGSRITVWSRTPGEDGAEEIAGAMTLDQALVEQIWGELRGSLPGLLNLAGAQAAESAFAGLPEQPLLFLHPAAWTERALGEWDCTRIELRDGTLLTQLGLPWKDGLPSAGAAGMLQALSFGDALPEAVEIARHLGIAVEFDARTGVWTAVRIAGAGPPGESPTAAFSLELRAIEIGRRVPAELLQPPADLAAEDGDDRARLLLPLMRGLSGMGGGDPQEF